MYGVKEETEEAAFAEIYPQYVGTVSSVRTEEKTSEEGRKYTVYYFKDNGMNWNPKDYEIPELDYMLQFQTGELAGRGTDGSFQAAWHEDTREWEIINLYPDDTTQIPGDVIVPNPGDKYIPWNFAMPQEYTTAAEQAYKQAVDDFLNTYSFDPNKYTGTTDRNYIEKNNTPLRIGWNVRLLSEQYFGSTGGYKDTRITKVQRKLNDLCQATITCSDEVGTGWKSSVDNSLNSLRYEVARQAEQYVYDVIRSFDDKTPSDKNVFSALKSLKTLLRKDAPDRTEFLMKLLGGIISPFLTSPDFVTGMMGAGMSFSSEKGGESVGWIDKLYVRKKAIFQLLSIMETELAGASFMFNASGARATITKVEFIEKKGIRFKDGKGVKFSDGKRGYSSPGTYGSVYRCYFLADDGEKAIENRFKPGNLVRSQSFNIKEGAYDGVSNHYWWRLVENVGDNWIEVSVNHCDEGSDIPAVGDVMVQLGDVSDTDFQAAIVLSAYGDGAPSLTFYQGISSYSLSGKDIVSIGYDRLTKEGYFNVYGKTYIGNRDKTNYIRLASGEIEVRAARILLSNGESVVDVAEKNISIKLGATGIDIEKNEIVISSDKFKIKSSEGKGIAVFTVKNGKPLLLTECIDVNSLKVKHLDGADGTFSGELKAAKGTFSGTISADGAKIGGFTIDNGSLNWKEMDFFGNDSRSIRIGVPTDDNSGMIDINFNGATDGKFGVKVIGSNDGGACIYASRNGTSKPHSSNTYAGYFDGGVHVNGNLYTNMILSNEFGTGWSLQADGSYTYKKGATRTISWTIQNGSIPSTYKLVFENGILVD